MTSGHYSFDVFLSHASEDMTWCGMLAERLRNHGVRVWFDQWELKPGDHLLKRVNEGIARSRKMIAIWSTQYFRNDRVWTFIESLTKQHGDPLSEARPLVPVLLEDCEIPPTLSSLIYIDFRNPEDFD